MFSSLALLSFGSYNDTFGVAMTRVALVVPETMYKTKPNCIHSGQNVVFEEVLSVIGGAIALNS